MSPRWYYATSTKYVQDTVVDDSWNIYRNFEWEKDHDVYIQVRMTSCFVDGTMSTYWSTETQ
jgi:hypothetical protein